MPGVLRANVAGEWVDIIAGSGGASQPFTSLEVTGSANIGGATRIGGTLTVGSSRYVISVDEGSGVTIDGQLSLDGHIQASSPGAGTYFYTTDANTVIQNELVLGNGALSTKVPVVPEDLTNKAYVDSKVAAVPAGVPTTRTITAGAGLINGGDLSANRTLDIGAGTGITVAADSVAVDTATIATRTYADTAASGAVTTHVGVADPHTGYQLKTGKDQANGYAGLGATSLLAIAQVPTGTTGTTVALGNHLHTGTYVPTTLTVTGTGGLTGGGALSGNQTISVATGGITNAMQANMNAFTVKGNNTGGPGVPVDLTASQLKVLIDVFGAGTSGLVPVSGGGTVNYLRADGNWVPVRRPVSTQSATAISLFPGDETAFIRLTGATAITVTLPSNATQPFPIGAEIELQWAGVGQPLFVAGSGATLLVATGMTASIRAQYGVATVKKTNTNEWTLEGDLTGYTTQKITVATTAPGSPATNDIWIDTT